MFLWGKRNESVIWRIIKYVRYRNIDIFDILTTCKTANEDG